MAWPVKEKILILWCLTDNLIDDSSCGIWNPTKDFFERPGAPLTYFNDGRGGPKDFLGLTFWPKGIFFGVYERRRIFLGRENNTGIFLGIVFFISSNQH